MVMAILQEQKPGGPPASTVQFTDSPALTGRESKYRTVEVNVDAVLQSWRLSLLSFEWLTPEGTLRTLDSLPLREREKRLQVEHLLSTGQKLERPVLGIGLMDNVEIGGGKAVFMTLAALGYKTLPVHIPVSCEKELKSFLCGS